jgi:SAM-dependent methyltransferase
MSQNADSRVPTAQSSAYAQMHLAEWVPVHYDEVMYAANSYDSFIWSLEEPFLRAVASALVQPPGGLRFLDFACGTGRITAALGDLSTESLGVDISPDMLAVAKAKVPRSQFRAGDILAQPEVAPGPYDLITAMRFFLNTEDEMRRRIMPILRALLAGPDSRLVFNVHMNTVNLLPSQVYRWLRGWPAYRTMTHWQARNLVRDSGLEIVDLHGFGLLPQRLHRGPLATAARWVDRRAAGKTPLNWVCRDLVFVCRLSRTSVSKCLAWSGARAYC